jgi:hypothetical protein
MNDTQSPPQSRPFPDLPYDRWNWRNIRRYFQMLKETGFSGIAAITHSQQAHRA